MASSSETHTLLTLPLLCKAILTAPAEGEVAPRDVARDVNLAMWAMVTLCSLSYSAVVPSGTFLDCTEPVNGPS